MLEESIFQEFREGNLDFVKGVLVASGETEVEKQLELIDSAAREITAEFGKAPASKDVFAHINRNKAKYWGLFRKVPVPSGGDCLLQTVVQNSLFSRLGFKSSVLRYVLQSTSHRDELSKLLYHTESCIEGEEMLAFDSYIYGSHCWVCCRQEFGNHSLIAYIYYQRGTDAFNKEKNLKLSTELYEKAAVFEENDFKIWLELGDNYRMLGEDRKSCECICRSELLKPKMNLMKKDDQKPFSLI